ncbi:MAG: hypothetical protein ACLR5P_03115 [[Eubacterium] siraeum]
MSKKHYLSNEDISILCSELASVVSSGLTITDGILVILQDGEDKNKAALLEKDTPLYRKRQQYNKSI